MTSDAGVLLDAIQDAALAAVAGASDAPDDRRLAKLLSGFPPPERAPNPYIPTPDEVQRRTFKLKQAGMMDVSFNSTSPGLHGSPFVEVSFVTGCGAVLRYRLERQSAVSLFESLGEPLQRLLWRDQSDRSSRMPSAEASDGDRLMASILQAAYAATGADARCLPEAAGDSEASGFLPGANPVPEPSVRLAGALPPASEGLSRSEDRGSQ